MTQPPSKRMMLETVGAFANPELTVTYNPDGSVASTTENGVATTYTYNADGTVATATRAGVTRTFAYDSAGNVTGAS
jgi:YD repeat-containing protein